MTARTFSVAFFAAEVHADAPGTCDGVLDDGSCARPMEGRVRNGLKWAFQCVSLSRTGEKRSQIFSILRRQIMREMKLTEIFQDEFYP